MVVLLPEKYMSANVFPSGLKSGSDKIGVLGSELSKTETPTEVPSINSIKLTPSKSWIEDLEVSLQQ